MSPKFIIKHPAEPAHESYTTEHQAIESAKELVKKHGGYAMVYFRIAMVDNEPVVTR